MNAVIAFICCRTFVALEDVTLSIPNNMVVKGKDLNPSGSSPVSLGDVNVTSVPRSDERRVGNQGLPSGAGPVETEARWLPLLRAAASGSDLTQSPVSEWMTRNPRTATSDMAVGEAADVMLRVDRTVSSIVRSR